MRVLLISCVGIKTVFWFANTGSSYANTFPAYSQQCRDDAGPPFLDDAATFGEGKKYHDGSAAKPVLTEDGECAPRMEMGCAFHGNAKTAYIEGPIDCGGNGWYCRILESSSYAPVNLVGDFNFGYCNTTEGQEDAGYDRSGHCHGSSDDTTYYWWMRDHWFRRYNGRLRCCCGWYSSNDSSGIQPSMVAGKITNRCDYRRLVVDENDANNCRDANEDHGLGYEDGCKGFTPINAPLVENDDQCWELLNFGDGSGDDDNVLMEEDMDEYFDEYFDEEDEDEYFDEEDEDFDEEDEDFDEEDEDFDEEDEDEYIDEEDED